MWRGDGRDASRIGRYFVLGGSLLALLLACGGKSATSEGAGGASHTAPQSCSYDGKRYASGDSFPATDGCNNCSCDDGSVECTEIGCSSSSCQYEGKTYAGGVTFNDADGDECICNLDGSVACTPPAQPVVSCEQVDTFYDQLLQDAKKCDPHDPNVCTLRVSSGLACGCDTFVDPSSWNQGLATAFATHYSALACASGPCGMCKPPLRGFCSVMQGCMDAYDLGAQPACKVDGVVYPDGTSGIPDPTSCNGCTCKAGALSCTEIYCPTPCPLGTKLAKSCAQCGPTDNCEVVEHSCRPTCSDTCAEGICIDGACLVGVCG